MFNSGFPVGWRRAATSEVAQLFNYPFSPNRL
jgi:hypothetical protein